MSLRKLANLISEVNVRPNLREGGLETSLREVLYRWFDTTQYFLSNGITRPLVGLCEDCVNDSHRYPDRFSRLRFSVHDLDIIAQYLVRKGWTPEDLELLEKSPDSLRRSLEKLPHTYRTNEREGEPSDIAITTPLQRLRCQILLDALQDKNLVNEIGAIVDDNIRNMWYQEAGGLVMCSDQRVSFHTFPSLSRDGTSFAINARELVRGANLALFHLHALGEDCSRYAGPSFTDPFNRDEKSDLAIAVREASATGQFHGIVVTKLKGPWFNIDYYGAEMNNFYVTAIPIVDLGNYKYRRQRR